MVLSVRVWGRDISGSKFEELAHTLDITPSGARLGAIHHHVKVGDTILIQYRQQKTHFRTVWIKLVEGSSEYQIGIEAASPSRNAWGLELAESKAVDDYLPPSVEPTSH
jgi:hypothetical protein